MQVPSILQGESLKRLLQGAVAGAIATIFVGFNWGGWSLGSTADKMAKERSELAVVAALARASWRRSTLTDAARSTSYAGPRKRADPRFRWHQARIPPS